MAPRLLKFDRYSEKSFLGGKFFKLELWVKRRSVMNPLAT